MWPITNAAAVGLNQNQIWFRDPVTTISDRTFYFVSIKRDSVTRFSTIIMLPTGYKLHLACRILGRIKKYKTNFNLKLSFLAISSLMCKEGFCKFSKKCSLLRSLWFFFKLKLCRTCGLKLPNFWNWTPKNISDRQKCEIEGFKKSEKNT